MAWIDDHHAEWLSLVETSGPFLTVPALKRALPSGLEEVPEAMSDLRIAHAELIENPALERRWVQWVLETLLGLGENVNEATDADPSHVVAEHGERIRPTYVVRDRSQNDAPVLLVCRYDSGTALDRPIEHKRWAASPIDRAVELAKASGVPLGLITNGQRWTLAWARQGESTGLCTWRSEIWIEEPITLRAFVELLGARRFFSLPVEEGVASLLQESAGKQQEVADQLGAQVRRATELLIETLDREDRDRHGELLQALPADEVYRGATTVMMRLVFLFVAEERRLLPIDDPRYAETLAASTLRAQLRERADAYDESILERSTAAWHRILALFRAVHGGVEHDALRLPAYGGGLFDPDRYPFLEGRTPGTAWGTTSAAPLPVDDRTMLHLLDQLQTLEQGGTRVQLSYQALDVEQIGHAYEGLLEHTALRITDVALGLEGKLEPEIALADLDDWAADGVLVEKLAKVTGRSVKAIEKALAVQPDEEAAARLRAACEADDAVLLRVKLYHGLLRIDLRGDPLVFRAGSLYVTQAIDRRVSGTYYTPRFLAEEVVKHTLDPVAYRPGPAEEPAPDQWVLRPASELLALTVADIAMGSGAFLVGACRYLAARLLEAWDALGDGEWSVFGNRHDEQPTEPAVPADPLLREQLAHRLVTERCLYGVDKNPMAVEMAKLSLWLVTLARDQPFSFVDHALRAGDSLLGITSIDQLRVAHLNPRQPRQASLDLGFDEIERAIAKVQMLRESIEGFVVHDVRDAERKQRLLEEADQAMADAKLLADLVVGAALSQQPNDDPLIASNVAANMRSMLDYDGDGVERSMAHRRLRAIADDWLVEKRSAVGNVEAVVWADREPFHWALEFPEVRAQGGFDAIVGNPPFQGGKKISGALGGQYRGYLVEWLGGGVRGHADLVAYFYLRAARLLAHGGGFGLIATNTIAQGDTREVGLDQLAEDVVTIHRAISSEPWPGTASLDMATVWGTTGMWSGTYELDRTLGGPISSALMVVSRVSGPPQVLATTAKRSFIGSYVNGTGFVLSDEEARAMVAAAPTNHDVVRPYLVGEDLNQRPDASPSRWVIDFRDWPVDVAAAYELPFAHVERFVRPQRAKVNRKAHRERWWQFGDVRLALYRALAPVRHCIAITITSKAVMPMQVRTGIVFGHKLAVLVYDDDATLALLSSTIHREWAMRPGVSTLSTTPNYIPTDCFETFVQPDLSDSIARIGRSLIEHRAHMMFERQEGLTATYNRVHSSDDHAEDVARLREIHQELDLGVRDAYGWTDLDLDLDFHETRFGVRFTFSVPSRLEVLDRLLELNHERYADELRRGLHPRQGRRQKASASATAGALSVACRLLDV